MVFEYFQKKVIKKVETDYTQLKYLKYHLGSRGICSHLDAQHAMRPEADLFTDRIVDQVREKTECACIISTTSRKVADINRNPDGRNNEAVLEYRDTIKNILYNIGILKPPKEQIQGPYLHLTIHGMKDIHYGPYAIEIGTQNGQSCSPEIMKWFMSRMTVKAKELFPQIQIVVDELFNGDESILFHRLGDGENYQGYGHHFHTFQIEISRTLRQKHLPEIVELLSYIILQFQDEIACS